MQHHCAASPAFEGVCFPRYITDVGRMNFLLRIRCRLYRHLLFSEMSGDLRFLSSSVLMSVQMSPERTSVEHNLLLHTDVKDEKHTRFRRNISYRPATERHRRKSKHLNSLRTAADMNRVRPVGDFICEYSPREDDTNVNDRSS
ncbi:hypothetical protein F2P81_020617 [Scophthalmus maximus]|uniref:Uncharacterized protein n=1 Tax=Scophthalmus maximus TaxID=52904 RepID=A0A6A4RYE7_SCOMX|nr:hypothetical protein F2P81_020617 [Scophthalmus maximus]